MEKPLVSLCASANRVKWWQRFYDSCKENTIPWEVVFVGNVKPTITLPDNFKFIEATVKPCQCYQIAFWHAEGELISWTADDADYNAPELNNPDSLGLGYRHWQNMEARHGHDKKSVIAMNPCEDGGYPQLDFHKFYGGIKTTPVMAPFCLINREYFVNTLGGYDKQFVSGQAENDVIMRVYEDGGRVEIVLDAKLYVRHRQVHPRDPTTGKEKNEFRAWYPADRERLENCWVEGGYGFYEKLSTKELEEQVKVSKTRLLPFEPFKNTDDVCTVTQGQVGQWG